MNVGLYDRVITPGTAKPLERAGSDETDGGIIQRTERLTFQLSDDIDEEAENKEDQIYEQRNNALMTEEEDTFESLARIFRSVKPTFRLVPSLSPSCEFAVEMKTSKPLLTSVIRETFETDNEITQILGEQFIILHQVVYDKLQVDSNLWNFLHEHVEDICEMDKFSEMAPMSRLGSISKIRNFELLKSFLTFAFRPNQSEQVMETFMDAFNTEVKAKKHHRTMTNRGYFQLDENPAIEMRSINNGETKVVRYGLCNDE